MEREQADLVMINRETGEVVEGLPVVFHQKLGNGFGRSWMAMHQIALGKLSQQKCLGVNARVMLALWARLDYENNILVSQAEIGRELELRPSHVNRAIKQLLEIGVILEGPRFGVNRSYRLNPEVGWKGKGESHRNALEQHRTAKVVQLGLAVVQGGKLGQAVAGQGPDKANG